MVNSTVEKLSPTRVKLHITVSPEELKPSIAHAYEQSTPWHREKARL